VKWCLHTPRAASACILLFAALVGCPRAELQSPPTDRGSFSAGFRILRIAQHTSEADPSVAALWYPTEAAESTYVYPARGLRATDMRSRVAANALPASTGMPHPLIIAAHGLFGSGVGLAYLGEYLARHGYVVAAPDYVDTVAPDFTEQWAAQRLGQGNVFPTGLAFAIAARRWASIMEPEPPKLLSYLETRRLRPTRALLDHLLALNAQPNSSLHGLLDVERVGMLGHSLGGYTATGLIGGHPHATMRDKRIKAAVLLSSGFHGYHSQLKHVAVPVMVMAGENDPPGLGQPDERYQLYVQSPPPKVFVVVEKATHLTFSNEPGLSPADAWQRDLRLAVITAYTTAFFDAFLRHKSGAREHLVSPTAGVTYHAYQWVGEDEHTWGKLPSFQRGSLGNGLLR
jgi:predicted dienelactone hydrolase